MKWSMKIDIATTIALFEDLIKEELNVKKITFTTDEEAWVSYSALPNSQVLGRRLGGKFKSIAAKIKLLSSDALIELRHVGSIDIDGEQILASEVVLQRIPRQKGAILSEGDVTIWLDTEITEELLLEGYAREIVNRIQKLRKEAGFKITDYIDVKFEATSALIKAIDTNREYICKETSTRSIIEVSLDADKLPIDDEWIKLEIK